MGHFVLFLVVVVAGFSLVDLVHFLLKPRLSAFTGSCSRLMNNDMEPKYRMLVTDLPAPPG